MQNGARRAGAIGGMLLALGLILRFTAAPGTHEPSGARQFVGLVLLLAGAGIIGAAWTRP
jgi:hypothetical protein